MSSATEANLWADMLHAINPSIVYETAWGWTAVVSIFAVLGFGLAPLFRILSEMIKGIKDNSPVNYRAVAIDVVITAFFYGAYTLLAYVLYTFMNNIFVAIDAFDHTSMITSAFASLHQQLDGSDVGFKFSDVSGSITANVFYVLWLITNLIYLGIAKFLHFAHAFTWGMLVVTGPVLIAFSSWSPTNWMKGWLKMLAVLIMWPILEWVTMGLASTVFQQAIDGISVHEYSNTSELAFKAILWAGMSIMNLIAIAITLSVPMLTFAIVSNSGNIAASVMPFAAAGGAAGAFVGKKTGGLVESGVKSAGKSAGKAAGRGVYNSANNMANSVLGKVASNEALRDAMPGVNSALNSMGLTHPSKTRLAEGLKAQASEGPRPGSVAHKFESLEKTPAMSSANSIRSTSVSDNGSQISSTGDSKTSQPGAPKEAGSSLSLEPLEDSSPITERSSTNRSSNTISKSRADVEQATLKLETESMGSGLAAHDQSPDHETTSEQSNEGGQSQNRKKARKGVMVDKTLKAQGKRTGKVKS